MTKKWLIGIADYVTPPVHIEQSAFPNADFYFLKDWRNSEEDKKLWQKVHGLLAWHYKVDAQTASILDSCKIVVRYGAGYDKIDIRALDQKGIVFCNTPDCGTTEVADTACAMILNLQRKVTQYDRLAKQWTDPWQKALKPIQRTNCQTLGIIGLGRIGSAVIKRMLPFGYSIIAYDPYFKGTIEGIETTTDIADLQKKCDIISLHCPLTNETASLVDAEFISKMKKGSSLVNTARGGILSGLDCIEQALRSGQFASVAMDVLPEEPPKPHPLIEDWRNDAPWLKGRLIINPHVADYSEQGWYYIHYNSAETIKLFLEEGKLRYQIKP